MNTQSDLPDEFRDMVDAYCSGMLDDDGVRRLEALLLESASARRYFTLYFHHHTEIAFEVRASAAAGKALNRLGRFSASPANLENPRPAGRWRAGPRARWLTGVAAGIAIASLTFVALRVSGLIGPSRFGPDRTPDERSNVAWLINAQDCRWTGKDQTPGRDMRSGKVLRLEQGLAEIEFDRGARVILQGPAGVELISATTARLLYGTITARVPAQARGFTVLSPSGKVVDLGTEFGLSFSGQGPTRVSVFNGLVEAFPLDSAGIGQPGVFIHQDQTAQIDGKTVAVDPPASGKEASAYVRAILPRPVRTPRTLSLDFNRPAPGTLLDRDGRGTGLTHRLPETGMALLARDPNLHLRPDLGLLELTTTRSDLNTQERMPTGEYVGFRLADLGFTGKEDFELSASMPNIPGLKVVGQFGIYVGAKSSKNIRGGLIRRPDPDSYRLFLVNNADGNDADIDEIGLMTIGDDLRLTLRRMSGRYSLHVDNVTRNSSSTLEITHPAFLDAEKDLHAGLFGANTQSDHRETLTIRELKVTVWTTKLETPTMAQVGKNH